MREFCVSRITISATDVFPEQKHARVALKIYIHIDILHTPYVHDLVLQNNPLNSAFSIGAAWENTIYYIYMHRVREYVTNYIGCLPIIVMYIDYEESEKQSVLINN